MERHAGTNAPVIIIIIIQSHNVRNLRARLNGLRLEKPRDHKTPWLNETRSIKHYNSSVEIERSLSFQGGFLSRCSADICIPKDRNYNTLLKFICSFGIMKISGG